MSRTVWTWGRLVGSAVILTVLIWRLGASPFLEGVRTVDAGALSAAVGLGVLTTVCCAWRWKIVAGGLGVRLPPPWRRTTGRCFSTSRCPAGSLATSTAGSAMVAT